MQPDTIEFAHSLEVIHIMQRSHLSQPAYRLFSWGMIVFLLLGSLNACSQAPASPGDLKGTISVSGAFALYPMMQRWTQEFQKLHPDVQFDVSAGGAGKGMADTLSGAVDIGMISRDITSAEEQKGAAWVAVAKDAVFPVFNAQNPLAQQVLARGVTREVFAKIYLTGEITTWGEVAGGSADGNAIHVYTRSDSAGAADTWAGYLGKKQENLKGIGVSGDPGISEAVVKDPLGIGYSNLNYAFDASTGKAVSGTAILPIDANGNGTADPDELIDSKARAVELVANGKYPSPPARLLYLATKGKPSGLTAAFLQWILTDGQKYLSETGYIAVPKDRLDQELKKIQ
jgi:phosphate transport system substrate-binding protein